MTDAPGGADTFHKGFLLLLVAGVTAAFLATIQAFLMALLLAAILSGLCQPLYRRLGVWLRGREAAASLLTILLVLLLIIGPLTTFMGLVAAQAVEISERAAPWLSQQMESGAARESLLARLELPEFLKPYQQQILAKLGEVAGRVSGFAVAALAALTKGTLSFILLLFVTLYAMFFFLRDGSEVLEKILYYMPLAPEDEDRMVERFVSVSRATIKGTLVIGVVQGGLAGLAFAVAGIHGAAFWGTVMALLSIIPGLGTALVWVPGVIYLVAAGHVVAGIGVAAWCIVVVGTADNFLRPALVGRDTKMPDLLILLSTLGGLMLFGAVGLVIGPVIAALFVTIWEIYGTTFHDYLPARESAATPGG